MLIPCSKPAPSLSSFARLATGLLILISIYVPSHCLGETTHQVFFKGTDSETEVYTIKGTGPGPTLLLLGGIQGDEPGGYLAADLFADVSLKRGNIIVVPRANFVSIVENDRGTLGDMNRKFAGQQAPKDKDIRVVELIKELMRKSDFFLNLHDGSGFYASKYESPQRNPMRFGQSIIADAETFNRPNGEVIKMGAMVHRVLEKVNPQIPDSEHVFSFNNHQTLSPSSKHKEQRLSATFHALTSVGIPAFGIETSKSISDYRIRVRYQTMVVNAFLNEFGIVLDSPKIYLENPQLKYAIVSVNGRTPIVINGNDVLRIHAGDKVRIVHIESNYSRGLSARIKGVGRRFNDLNHEVPITENTMIQVRKDRFLIGSIPVETISNRALATKGVHFEPKVKFFCIRVNNRTPAVEPDEEITITKGDSLTILDPYTNLNAEDQSALRIDLRGFQAEESGYPSDDRSHKIDTAKDLQQKYARSKDGGYVFTLQAKLYDSVIAECYIFVTEPKLEYVVLREPGGSGFVVAPGDSIQLPSSSILEIVDVKTNATEQVPLFITMMGKTVPWQQNGNAGIDASMLPEKETPLDIVRNGHSMGRIWLRQGKEFQVTVAGGKNGALIPAKYH